MEHAGSASALRSRSIEVCRRPVKRVHARCALRGAHPTTDTLPDTMSEWNPCPVFGAKRCMRWARCGGGCAVGASAEHARARGAGTLHLAMDVCAAALIARSLRCSDRLLIGSLLPTPAGGGAAACLSSPPLQALPRPPAPLMSWWWAAASPASPRRATCCARGIASRCWRRAAGWAGAAYASLSPPPTAPPCPARCPRLTTTW